MLPGLWRVQVVQVKTNEKEGYTSLQLGCGAKRPKQLLGTLRGHYDAAGAAGWPQAMAGVCSTGTCALGEY